MIGRYIFRNRTELYLNTQGLSITRMMIDTAVSRGIEQMSDDPKRSIRRMADMGKQFSSGRFQQKLMDIFQKLLESDDSPYYAMVENFLNHTDHKVIKKFGINMGYNAWTYGARILRSKSEEMGVSLPWVLNFRFDPSKTENTVTVNTLRRIIQEAKPLGIYAFAVSQLGGTLASDDLISLFRENSDCAFFYFLKDAQITAAQTTAIKKCGNIMLSIDVSGDQHEDENSISHETCQALQEAKALYSIHYRYDDDILKLQGSVDEEKRLSTELLAYNSAMIFLLPADDCTGSFEEEAKALRMEQKYPCFIWDWNGDVRSISQILCDNETYIEFDTDGHILLPAGNSDLSVTDESLSLVELLRTVMPKLSIPDPA